MRDVTHAVLAGEHVVLVVVPDSGSGTPFLDRLDVGLVQVKARTVRIGAADQEPLSLKAVMRQVVGNSKKDGRDPIERFFDLLTVPLHDENRVVLLVDGAERLAADTIGYLRLVMSTFAPGTLPLQMVLTGRESMCERLLAPGSLIQEGSPPRFSLDASASVVLPGIPAGPVWTSRSAAGAPRQDAPAPASDGQWPNTNWPRPADWPPSIMVQRPAADAAEPDAGASQKTRRPVPPTRPRNTSPARRRMGRWIALGTFLAVSGGTAMTWHYQSRLRDEATLAQGPDAPTIALPLASANVDQINPDAPVPGRLLAGITPSPTDATGLAVPQDPSRTPPGTAVPPSAQTSRIMATSDTFTTVAPDRRAMFQPVPPLPADARWSTPTDATAERRPQNATGADDPTRMADAGRLPPLIAGSQTGGITAVQVAAGDLSSSHLVPVSDNLPLSSTGSEQGRADASRGATPAGPTVTEAQRPPGVTVPSVGRRIAGSSSRATTAPTADPAEPVLSTAGASPPVVPTSATKDTPPPSPTQVGGAVDPAPVAASPKPTVAEPVTPSPVTADAAPKVPETSVLAMAVPVPVPASPATARGQTAVAPPVPSSGSSAIAATPAATAPAPSQVTAPSSVTAAAALPTIVTASTAQSVSVTRPAVTSALSPDVLRVLLVRGDDLLQAKDVLSARKMYERAAEGGSARGATLAGNTYDPRFLLPHGVQDSFADPSLAARWYQHAIALGDDRARDLLMMLEAVTSPR